MDEGVVDCLDSVLDDEFVDVKAYETDGEVPNVVAEAFAGGDGEFAVDCVDVVVVGVADYAAADEEMVVGDSLH